MAAEGRIQIRSEFVAIQPHLRLVSLKLVCSCRDLLRIERLENFLAAYSISGHTCPPLS